MMSLTSNSMSEINENITDSIPKFVPKKLSDDIYELALRLVHRVGGRNKAIALTALSISGLAVVRLYWKYIRIPPHLRGLPCVPLSFTFRNLYKQAPSIQRMNDEYELVVKEALRRGIIKSKEEHLTMWGNWQNGKWDLVLANPTDIKDMLSHSEVFEKIDVTTQHMYGMKKFVGGTNISLQRTPEWKDHKKIINPAFRRGWATSLFSEATSQLIKHLDKLASNRELVDISQWMSCMALDALSIVVFGKNFDSINHPNSDLMQVYNGLMGAFLDPRTNLFGDNLMKYSAKMKKFNSDVDHFNEYVYKWIDEKMDDLKARGGDVDTDNNDAKNLLEMMVSGQLEHGETYTREGLRSDCAFFFMAGHDTTAGTLTFAMYLLGMNERVQEKVRKEVIKIMGDAKPKVSHDKFVFATNEQQNAMRYLTCVIKETMRVFPPLPAIPTREVTKEHNLASTGLRLPKASFVQGSLLVLHHSKEYWGEDADEFRPERWESLTPADEPIPLHAGATNFTWVPFGGGQRVCIGQQFSIVEQRVVLSALLLRYTWKVVGDDAALRGCPTVSPGILLHPQGIRLQLSRRK